MKKSTILKLNANWQDIGEADWYEVIKNMCVGTVYPLDIVHPQEDDGKYILEEIESMMPVKTWQEWVKLPLRPYDEYVQTPKGPVRLPSVVVCADFQDVVFVRTLTATKKNIWERDKYTCGYCGDKLRRDDCTIDHIIPVSKGGKSTWENQITCCAKMNRKKADKTLAEAGMKLLWKPTQPQGKNIRTTNCSRPEWTALLRHQK